MSLRHASHLCLALVFMLSGCFPGEAKSPDSAPQRGQKRKKTRENAPPSVTDIESPQATLPPGVDVFNSDYVGAPLSVDLDAAPLFQFLEFFAEQFGFSFVLDRSVKEGEPISVRARRLPWNLLVKAVLQSRGLTIQEQGGLYRVLSRETLAAEEEERRKMERDRVGQVPPETKIYRLRYRSVRTGGYLRTGGALGTGGAAVIGGGIGGGIGATPVVPAERTEAGSPPPGLISGFRSILVNQLTKDGTIEEDPVANLLIIRDVPAVHERIGKLLAELDRPEPQIEIEARILIARRDYTRQLGALLNAAVNGRGAAGQGGTATNPIAGNGNAPVIPGAQPSEILGLGAATAGVIGGAVQRGTYALSAALSALETRGVAQTILAPRLIVVNNSPANIGNGVDIPYVQAGPVPGGGGPGGPGGGIGFGVVPTTQLVNASLGFSVTPQILGEGEEILLAIEIRNDSPSGATPLGQPIIQRQNVTTSIRCPNGGALLLSGLLSDREDQTVNAIPGLRSLPILGKLFQRQERNRTQFELIFFVTARVLNEVAPTVMVERPEGIVIPNSPEYAAPQMPELDMPKRLRERSLPDRKVLVEKPSAPNLPPVPKGGPRNEE